jgi:hypothetical protein
MTASTRTSAPSYKIFEPDALDQIYAKGNLDPIMGGISYAFGSAHKQEAAGNQDRYLQSQEKFNRMAATLDAMEMDSKTKQKALEIGGQLIAKGEDPTKIIGSDLIYGDPAQNLLPGLLRDKIQSEINSNNAPKGGGDGKAKTVDTFPYGEGTRTVTTPGVPAEARPSEPATKPGSTPAAPKDKSSAIAQGVVKTAITTLGQDAQWTATKDGGSKWMSPSKPGVTLEFDKNGVAKR